MMDLEALSCTISPRVGGQSISKTASIPFIVHSTKDGSTQNWNYYCQAPPPCVYPLFSWHNRIWPNLPGLPPLCLHTAKYWRWECSGNEAMYRLLLWTEWL